jgi:hypothetical protein
VEALVPHVCPILLRAGVGAAREVEASRQVCAVGRTVKGDADGAFDGVCSLLAVYPERAGAQDVGSKPRECVEERVPFLVHPVAVRSGEVDPCAVAEPACSKVVGGIPGEVPTAAGGGP